MAIKLIQPPKSAPHLLHPIASGTMQIMRVQRAFPATHSNNKIYTKHKQYPLLGPDTIALAKANEQSFGVEVENEKQTVQPMKASLYDALQGINRGIFGVPSEKKAEIEKMVKLLESQNPCPEPTANLEKMAGTWRLVYSTITILGSKRTKLGLRDFISLGDFYQNINVIERVDILYQSSTISPEQLMNLFEKNYNLLLSIFNPEGWLNITYVDDDFRIGRDDKGNVFVLERIERE